LKYPEEFEQLWLLRVPRAGNNPKRKGFNAVNARLREGHKNRDIRGGLIRYMAYCKAVGILGTTYVMHFATFVGPDENFLEDWELPKPDIKETLEEKAKRLGVVAQPGWAWEEFERRVQQAR